MIKTALLLLAISTGIDFVLGFGGALTTAMLATEAGKLPSWGALIFAAVTGLMNAARTLQPVLRAMLLEHGIKFNGETNAVVKAAAKT